MPSGLDLLGLLVGGGEGYLEGRRESQNRAASIRRQILAERELRSKEDELQSERGFKREELGLRKQQLDIEKNYREGLVNAKSADEEEVIPGGLDVLIQGKPYHIPGRKGVLDSFLPYLREEAERKHRERFPHLYRSPTESEQGLTDKDKMKMRLDLLRETYGSPTLGETPGARKALYEELLDQAQRDPQLTQIFGPPKATDAELFLDSIKDDPRFATYEDAREQLKIMKKTNPQAYARLEPYLDQLESHFAQTLPRRRKVTPKGPDIQGARLGAPSDVSRVDFLRP